MGQPAAFGTALATIGFSDTWQLVINTGTTIITFLMVFLIQNTQNKDAEAMQIKLDELIRAIEQARNALLNPKNWKNRIWSAFELNTCSWPSNRAAN